jgi:PIN domain nuclease of toxin-antitoxin system
MYGIPAASSITVTPLVGKHQIGKLRLDRDLSNWFRDAMAGNVEILPIVPEVVVDAMDRLLPAGDGRGPPAFVNRLERR